MTNQGKNADNSPGLLDRIEIVLSRPRFGGNVGAAARVVKNMGLGGLRLVSLEKDAMPEARMFAVGAVDILENAPIFDTLEEALAGAGIIFGTSRRVKSSRVRIMTPREAVAHILENLGKDRALIVFGPEDTGLTSRELSLCHGIISIPADERYPSLNLAQAVMVLSYDLRMAAGGPFPVTSFGAPTPEEKEQMLTQVMAVLERSGFFLWNPREKVILHMREILARGVRTSQDARIIRGVFRRIAWALAGEGKAEALKEENEVET